MLPLRLSCFFILLAVTADGQLTTSSDSLSHRKFLTMVNINKDQSYATFGNGLGNQRPILFEAKLSPNYFISSQHKDWALVMNPSVQIRMLDEKSVPIQVPSYRFNLTYYHDLDFVYKSFLRNLLYEEAIWFAGISHHSNGQSGNFYDSTKVINTTTGNFSVNFIQLGISTYTLKPSGANYFSLREIKVHTEIYPAGLCDTYLNRNYGFYRIFGTFGFSGPWKKAKNENVNRWLENSSIEIKAGWILDEYRGYSPSDIDKRLIVDVTYKYYPPWFDEVAFFVRYYKGQDYYNIYFEKQLSNLTVGITSNTIKLSSAVRNMASRRKKNQL